MTGLHRVDIHSEVDHPLQVLRQTHETVDVPTQDAAWGSLNQPLEAWPPLSAGRRDVVVHDDLGNSPSPISSVGTALVFLPLHPQFGAMLVLGQSAVDRDVHGVILSCVRSVTYSDLYKHAFRLSPMISSDLVADCFELAWDIRTLDMRAAPYDLADLGFEPVRIETVDGKAEYVEAQRGFAERSAPLRERLIAECTRLLESI